MPDHSNLLTLPFIQPSQAQKHVTFNEAIQRLDALVQLVVLDSDQISPPADPEPGDRHIVAEGATGHWSGWDQKIAMWDGTAWQEFTPLPGWRAEVLALGATAIFGDNGWVTEQVEFDNLTGLGVGTESDATNRLAVSSPATLLGHAGAGHQVKVNKATPSDTASLLFQTQWSGRAEMGLSGNDNWSIKISPDGSNWTEALTIASDTGQVGGAAVQTSLHDVSQGRLMRADFGYSPGNLLGAVSQTAGVPQGAALERGSDANGEYMRLADGTQVCTGKIDLTVNQFNNMTGSWTFPQGFADVPIVLATLPASGASFINCQASQLGATRQSEGTDAIVVSLAGLETLSSSAEIIGVRVIAFGRWF